MTRRPRTASAAGGILGALVAVAVIGTWRVLPIVGAVVVAVAVADWLAGPLLARRRARRLRLHVVTAAGGTFTRADLGRRVTILGAGVDGGPITGRVVDTSPTVISVAVVRR